MTYVIADNLHKFTGNIWLNFSFTATFVLGLALEILQWYFGFGTFEFKDIINNSIGGTIGVLWYKSITL